MLDDHQIIIDGLKLLLYDKPKFVVVAEANTAEDMLQVLATKEIDILLTDITMPNGINGFELAVIAKEKYPHIKILALSMSEEGSMVAKMMEQAKVNGYIAKAAGQKELLTAIETIIAGDTYFSKAVLEQYEVFKKIRNQNSDLNLTTRELQIIECIIKYYSNKQIAEELFISERTVETHRKNIYRKTNTKGEASLIQFVKAHKLIP
ncbi:MAG TPA: response regulator transcription factor [Panacibacter sp.]|nr:response regulator transcription factor [Panacibacter sp.]HNP43503.1 response regulator transcription factor [Panacibacter sp.]